MATYNQIYKYTITNGGGTLNLPVSDANTSRYVFSGTATLAANWVIQPSGSPTEGIEFDIRWQSACTIGANSVTIFGTALTADQALNDLIISCYYNGSSWDVDITQDGIQDVWEVGSGTGSAKRVGFTNTASGNYSTSEGLNNVASGEYSHTEGIDTTASTSAAHAEGNGTIASGSGSHSEGNDTTASGDSSHAEGRDTTASSTASHAEGQNTSASQGFTHSGGYYSIAGRYGQMSRASGRPEELNTSDYSQWSKLTSWTVTEDATPLLSYLDGVNLASSVISIPSNSIAYFRIEAVAIQQAGSAGTVGDSASWHMNGCIKNVSGTTSLVDTVRYQDNTGAWGAAAQRTQDAAAAAWTIVPTANNGTDTLDITVTGEANKTIYWLINIELTEIRYTP